MKMFIEVDGSLWNLAMVARIYKDEENYSLGAGPLYQIVLEFPVFGGSKQTVKISNPTKEGRDIIYEGLKKHLAIF